MEFTDLRELKKLMTSSFKEQDLSNLYLPNNHEKNSNS